MTTRGAHRLLPVLLAVVLGSVLASCGVRSESTANRVDPTDVPFDLLEGEAPDPTEPGSGRSVGVFFVADDKLVEVERSLAATDGIEQLVNALSEGPTASESTIGIASSLPDGHLAEVTTSRGVAQVDLRSRFADLRSEDQVLAIAQIVFTLTGQPGIGRVGFTLDGESIEVPRGDGALTTDPLSRDDFPDLAPQG